MDEIKPGSCMAGIHMWMAFVRCCNVTQCHGHRFSGGGIPGCGQCVLPLPLPIRKVCRMKSGDPKLLQKPHEMPKPHGLGHFTRIAAEMYSPDLAGPCFRFRQYHAWNLETAADLQVRYSRSCDQSFNIRNHCTIHQL